MASRESNGPLRVGVVDDHPLVRGTLAGLIRDCPDLELAGEGANGRDALQLARSAGLQVLVLDLEMPGMSGLDAIPALRNHAPDTGILVLSAYPPQQYAVRLLRRGIRGYLTKDCEPQEILSAVRAIGIGRTYLTPEVAELVAAAMHEGAGVAPHRELSTRELQVLLRLARGQSTRQVAQELFLSTKTIGACRARLFDKLGLHSVSDITYYAVKHGLVN